MTLHIAVNVGFVAAHPFAEKLWRLAALIFDVTVEAVLPFVRALAHFARPRLALALQIDHVLRCAERRVALDVLALHQLDAAGDAVVGGRRQVAEAHVTVGGIAADGAAVVAGVLRVGAAARRHRRNDGRFAGRFHGLAAVRRAHRAREQSELAASAAGRFQCGHHFLLLQRALVGVRVVQVPRIDSILAGRLHAGGRLLRQIAHVAHILHGRQRRQYDDRRRATLDFDQFQSTKVFFCAVEFELRAVIRCCSFELVS